RMSAPAIVVLVAADTMFVKQLAVVIAGISKSANRDHELYVLHDGYESALKDRISRSANDAVALHWLDARSANLNAAQLPAYLPTAALFRLRLSDLLPDDIQRIIYLDTDTAVRSP